MTKATIDGSEVFSIRYEHAFLQASVTVTCGRFGAHPSFSVRGDVIVNESELLMMGLLIAPEGWFEID